MTIIERDIEFYEGELARLQEMVHKCHPVNEELYRTGANLAFEILHALREYKRWMFISGTQ